MKKTFAILILLFLIAVARPLCANTIDSLENIAATTRSDSKRIDVYNELSKNYIGHNDVKSDYYFDAAVELCIKERQSRRVFDIMLERIALCGDLNRTDLIVKAIDNLQQFIDRSDMYAESINVYNKAFYAMIDDEDYELAAIYLMKSQGMAETIGDTAQMIHDAFNLGYCFSMINDLERAIGCYKTAERLTIAVGDSKGLIDIYMNQGTAYEHRKMLDTALNYHFKALECSRQSNDQSLLWLLYYNVAFTYFDKEQFGDALVYCRQALSSPDIDGCPWPKKHAMLYSFMADVYERIGRIDSCILCLNECGKYFGCDNDRKGEALTLCRLGNAYQAANNLASAKNSYNRALDICLSENLAGQLSDVYEGLAQMYKRLDNHELAYRMLLKAHQITDSLLSTEREQAEKSIAQQLQAKEQLLLIEHEISKNRQKQQFENERQESRHRMLTGTLIAVALIALIVVLILLHVRNINSLLKKANNEIHMQKNQLEDASLRIRRRYKFLDLLINTIPTPLVYVKTDDSVVMGCNEAFEHLCNTARESIVGSTLDRLRELTGVDLDVDRLRNLNSVSQMRFADGELHDVMCYVSSLVDEGGYGDLDSIVVVDVTELENTRRKLCQSQIELEDALNVKTKFFSIFAHDLKNPFNGILGMTNLIAEYYENYSSAEIKKYLNVINDSATHVYDLLTNLLDWVKTQTGMLEVSPSTFCISEPIRDAITLNKHNIDLKHIVIDMRTGNDYSVVADKNMVLTIFRNLIGNALKYTPEGGHVSIATRLDSDMVEVSISDNGIGISPENLQRLFNANHPITTPGLANEKGSGLGLIICQEFVRSNGGQISVSSEVGKGTTFTFTLNRA